MGAFACAATTLEATFVAHENRMQTVALRRLRAPHRCKTLEKKAFQHRRALKIACESARMCYFPRRFSLRGNSGTRLTAHKFFEE
jgi:hypothetical protein